MIEALTQYVTSSSEAADDPPHYHYHTGKLHHNHTTPHHYDKMAGARNISTILEAASVSVESCWPGMFARAAAGLDLKAMAGGVGSGGGAAGGGGGAVGAALAAAAAAQLL